MIDEQNAIDAIPLHLEPGDILFLRMGLDMGDGQPPWLPGTGELENAEEAFRKVVPQGVKVVAFHAGIDAEIIKCNSLIKPPKACGKER